MKNCDKKVIMFFETLLLFLVLVSCIFIGVQNCRKTSKTGAFPGSENQQSITFSDLAKGLEEKYFCEV